VGYDWNKLCNLKPLHRDVVYKPFFTVYDINTRPYIGHPPLLTYIRIVLVYLSGNLSRFALGSARRSVRVAMVKRAPAH